MIIWKNKEYKLIKLNTTRCGCFVLQHKKYNILVDTSMAFERRRLTKSLEKNHISHIDAIVLTHNHSDHAGNAAYLQQKYNCPIYIDSEGMNYVKKGICKIPDGSEKVFELVIKIAKNTPFRKLASFRPCENVIDIMDDSLTLMLGKDVSICKTPGHTKDSSSLFIADQVALVGDAFVRYPWMRTVFLPYGDHNVEASIVPTWKKLLSSGCNLFCQAHGNPTSRDMLERTLR